ncbi:MAG: hypothetical protein ACOCYR_03975, partial [Erythrobacter sp.]
MRRSRILPAAGALALGGALSGCVAAAIPVIAGGAVLRTGTDGKDARVMVEDVIETPPPPALAPVPLAEIARDSDTMFAGPAPAPEGASAPAPDALAAPGYAEFLAFAASAATGTAASTGAARPSALLADPASLESE